MTFGSIFVLAVGVSLDATAVAAARGLAVERLVLRHVLKVALWFGLSQGLMPLLGSVLGRSLGRLVMAWDHWVAFVLLAGVGAHMLYEGLASHADEPAQEGDPFGFRTMLILALATSIDAFAVGVTFPMVDAPVALSCATIGVTTACFSVCGLFAGRRFGALFGHKLDALGGLILIGLGANMLVQHLTSP